MNTIFKKIPVIILSILLGMAIFSCDDYLDINESPNSPDEVGNLNLLIADITATTSYNLVGGGNFTRWGASWVQHIANNAAPPSIDTYRFNTASMNNEWAFFSYAGVLMNSQVVIDDGTISESWNHVAVAKILMAHNYAILTDYFGEIPFTEALQRAEELQPTYDDQETVYAGVQDLLDEAIADINRDAGEPIGAGDYYFGGDMQQWLKVANALKARYHLRLTNAPGRDAATQAGLALDALDNTLQSNEDNANFDYPGDPGAEAPWQQWVTKFAFNMQVSAYFIDLLTALNDPRLPIMADQSEAGNEYVGHPSGAILPDFNLRDVSSIGSYFLAADASVPLITFAEVKFIEAEAALRTGDITRAETAYTDAIQANMQLLSGEGEFNTVIDEAMQNAYLTANPLNSLEDIITQKYIAGFVVASAEAYNDYRRTGFPSTLQPAQNADFEQIPTRIPYTDTEINNNLDNVPEDIMPTSRVWWDVD